MKLIGKIICIILFTGCTPSLVEMENNNNVDLANLCENANVKNWYACSQVIEKPQLKKYSEYIKRVDNKLIINLRNNKEKILSDFNHGKSNGKSYSFRTYFKTIGYYLVSIAYWEGSAYLLINDKTGESYKIDDLPIISPDKRRFVTASCDIHAEYRPSRIQIHKLLPEKLILEYSYYSPSGWGPLNARWTNKNNINFMEKTIDSEITRERGIMSYEFSPMSLSLTNGEWQ